MAKHCSKCGEKLREGANFCEFCGSKVIAESPKKSKEEVEKELRERIEQEFRDKEEKCYKKQKEKEIREEMKKKYGVDRDFRSHFTIKPDKREIRHILLMSGAFSFVLIMITILIGAIFLGQIHEIEEHSFEIGFPLAWYHGFRTQTAGGYNPAFEVSNWLNLILDFVLYFILIAGLSYLYETIRKN